MQLVSLSGGDAGGSVPASAVGPPVLELHGLDDPRRPEVELFVREVYARRYGARVPTFAPMLVSLRDPVDGGIVAAAGYRLAGHGRLFLERYLDAPIESMLAAHAQVPPRRGDVVEIAHLSSGRPGAGRALMLLLGPHLAQQGFGWVVCTLTQELRRLLMRLGITPLALAKANPAALAADAADWGSYYDHEPLVLAGELQPSLRHLAQHTGVLRGAA